MNKKYLYIGLAVIIAIFIFSQNSKNNNVEQRKNIAMANTGLSIGDKAPSFQITTIDNKTILSDDLRGKVVMLTSSASWCQTGLVLFCRGKSDAAPT